MPDITLEGVAKTYDNGVDALHPTTMEIADGEFLVLVGPSGCGKSTLLKMLAGLEPVTSGRISVGGQDITYAEPRDRDIAMVFQNYALYPHMTVRANLSYSLKVRGWSKTDIASRVDSVAAMLGLTELLDRRPSALSGGQRQRVAMGRAIVREPAAFLMDEPLSNLDAKLRVKMRAQLASLHERLRTTTVYVTHDQTEAMTLGERVVVMHAGRVQQIDTPQQLYRRPANLIVATFIGSPSMNVVEGVLTEGTLHLAEHRIALGERPDGVTEGRRYIVGIRPEDFEIAPYAEPDRPTIDVRARVVEQLGSTTHVLFSVDAAPVDVVRIEQNADALDDEDARALADEQEAAALLGEGEATVFTAAVDSRADIRVGDVIKLAVDVSALHYFDPSTYEAIQSTRTATTV
jgi:multiple sugar transport system ATP-binding protein